LDPDVPPSTAKPLVFVVDVVDVVATAPAPIASAVVPTTVPNRVLESERPIESMLIQQSLKQYVNVLTLAEILRPFDKSGFVDCVPDQFETTRQYVDTFRPMLRETVRTSCERSLRQIALSDDLNEVDNFWVSAHIGQSSGTIN
jgi:hypothetical protein